MKKVLLFAAMLAIAASCTVQEIDSIKGTTAPEITASYENNGTKTTITTDEEGVGTIWWKPADEINVFYGTLSTHYTSKNTENATTVAFGTTDIIGSTESASENIWGLYPYNENAVCDGESVTTTIPVAQQAIAGSFDDDIFTSLAHSTSTVMTFYNVLGGIKFSLSRDDIQTITFKGNNDEDIAGKVKLEMDANGKPVAEIIEGEKTITLTPKEGTTFAKNTNYYIVMLPTVLSNGFTMTFETEMEIGTFEYTTKSIEIKRSVFSKKENIDSYATFVDKPTPSPEYVDLGLSVMWATCNIGASKPEDYGGYYQWAGLEDVTSTDINLSWSNCPYHTGDNRDTGWTKYIPSDKSSYWSGAGSPDNKTVLDPDDDVAHVKFGGKWRIPTEDEWRELKTNCNWTEKKRNGVKGIEITSEKSGYTSKSIFLPAAGSRDGYQLNEAESYYCFSTLSTNHPGYCGALYFSNIYSCYLLTYARYNGISVRPVYDEAYHTHNLERQEGKAPTATESGYKEYYKCSICFKYYEDSAGLILIGDDLALKVWQSEGGAGYLSRLDYVDLGLSVKWATCNLGASKPEECGGYYQWAGLEDVTSTDINLDFSNWPYNSGNSQFIGWTKYIPSNKSSYWSGDGSPDNKTVLDPDDDVAHKMLGGMWRMPTKIEYTELINNCSWTWTTQNGVKGYKVTSKMSGYIGNWIFLPAAGQRNEDYFVGVGSHAQYWSSTLMIDHPECACVLDFNDKFKSAEAAQNRFYGRSIRPVLE